jgi:type III pantothenate kinase
MFIAIDIGNTHTVFGIYKRARLLADWRVTTMLQRTEDEVGTQVLQFLAHAKVRPSAVEGIGISSVVPNLTDVYAMMARKYFGRDALVVSSALDLGIRIFYEEPRSVGADRLCNAIAAFARYGGPLIIIDFGTATTYDVIAANGDYLGGVIAPGIETSASDLHRRAARLPKIELHLPDRIIGTDTVSSMQGGILWGAIDAMEGMVRRIEDELSRNGQKRAIVIATGGFSAFVSRHSTVIEHLEPSLVLDGIRLIASRAMPRRR